MKLYIRNTPAPVTEELEHWLKSRAPDSLVEFLAHQRLALLEIQDDGLEVADSLRVTIQKTEEEYSNRLASGEMDRSWLLILEPQAGVSLGNP